MRPRTISPRFAYSTMLRASSEIAVAIRTRLLFGKPSSEARARPRCRAVRISTSEPMGTRVSSPTRPLSTFVPLDLLIQEREPLLQVERRCHPLQREPQLHHREGDLGLEADDHGLCPAQADHVGDVAQHTGGEGIHHVERRHVDDDAARPKASHLLHQSIAELQQVGVGEGRLDAGDQVGSLLEDGDFHGPPPYGVGVPVSATGTTLYPSRCSASSMPPCRSPTVFIFPRSTPMLTRVWAISGDNPVTMTVAPRSRDASTVSTRWLATFESMAATPVMSMTTTRARFVPMPRRR